LRGRIPAGSGVRIDYRDEEFVFEPLPAAASDGKSPGKGGTKVETVGVR
jgi:hypothetical protein